MDNIQHSIMRVIDGKRYNTETATLIASRTTTGCGSHLYRTRHGAYFVAHSTIWEGSRDSIEIFSEANAVDFWNAHEQEVDLCTAFPNIDIVEA